MKKRRQKIIEEFPDEVAMYKEIPPWFNKFVKKAKTKRTLICWSRGYGKNWFYDWWRKHNAKT